MILFGFQNAASSKIAVTGTATLLKDLINTAGSVSHVFPGGLNGIDLVVEDGDVRILFDGNTPTANNGILLKQGTGHHFRNVDFHQAKLIRTGGSNVACSVQVGFVDDNEEVTNSYGGSGSGSGSSGDIQTSLADARSNTVNAQSVDSRVSGYNGSTWDRLRAGITAVTSTLTGWLNTLPWAIYHASPSTRTDGQGGPLEADSAGNLKTREQYAPAYEDNTNAVAKVEQRFSYANITSATTTTVKSGAGFLHAITVNTTAAGTITIYDNTAGSGTKIGTLKASVGEQTFEYNVSFATGLTIVTAAASDITVSYR